MLLALLGWPCRCCKCGMMRIMRKYADRLASMRIGKLWRMAIPKLYTFPPVTRWVIFKTKVAFQSDTWQYFTAKQYFFLQYFLNDQMIVQNIFTKNNNF